MASSKNSRRKTNKPRHHRQGFDKFYADIITYELDKGLVDCLVSWLVLTIEDADRIREESKTKRNQCLLNILKRRPYNTFSLFTEALKATDPMANDLVTEMKTFEVVDKKLKISTDVEMDDLTVQFQKSYKTLVNEISSPINLVDILLQMDLFNREDMEEIESQTRILQQNRKLLSKVGNKHRGFKLLLKALKESNDPRDQELANEVENIEITQSDKQLLNIGLTAFVESEKIPSSLREIAQELQDNWAEEDEVFVETKGTAKVFDTINEKNVITIVGSSGSGKTAVMRHVVLKLKSKERFYVIRVKSPSEIMKYRKSNTKQIFIMDDVIGTYSIQPTLVDKWERLDDEIQQCLGANQGKMKLLFTLRKQLANNETFINCSSVVNQNIVDLEDLSISLSKEEKKEILNKHLRVKGMGSYVTEDDLEEACASDFAFPLLCKIVSSDEERLQNIAKFFREPFSILEKELRKLSTENKTVYCSLVFCMLLNGKIERNWFDLTVPKDVKFSIVTEACGLDSNISRPMIKDSLESVVGTYVSREESTFHFMHDAFLESISSNFAKRNPGAMLSCCDIDFIRERVRINSRLRDDDENVIVVNKDQFEVIAKRVLNECESGKFTNVLLSQVILNEEFVEYLGAKLNSRNQTAINKLMRKVSVERHINQRTIYYFIKSLLFGVFSGCVCCNRCTAKTADDTNLNKIATNNAALKYVIRSPSRHSTFIHWILASGCYTLFRYFWENASKDELRSLMSRDLKYPLTKPFFALAVLGGNIGIIRKLCSSGADVNCFSNEGETPLTITAKSGRKDIAAVLIELGADVNQADMLSHRYPSFICVENENVEVLKVLLNNNCDVNLVDIYGRSSTMLQALMTRKRDIIDILLKFDSKDHHIHVAILNGDVDYLKTHLEKRDINTETRNGMTPLHYATQVSDTVMLRSLLGCHTNEEPVDNLTTTSISHDRPLMSPTAAKINAKNKNGLTALHFAVLNDHVKAVQMLVDRNADVSAKDEFGRIPLHYSQNPVISSMLLNRRNSVVTYSAKHPTVVTLNQSDMTVVNIGDVLEEEYQQTLSWFTVIRNVARFFLPFKRCIYSENIDNPDNQGNTPLHVAVETSRDMRPEINGNYDSEGNIKFLMTRGANIHLRNDNGDLFSDLVRKSNDSQIHRLFKQLKSFTVFNSDTSGINRNRENRIVAVLLIFALILSYAFIIAPVTTAMENILNKYNNLTDSLNSNSNQTDIDRLKIIEHEVDAFLMHYFFLVGIVFYIMTNVMIVRAVMQLWKPNCRQSILCAILIFIVMMMGCSAVTLLVVYEKSFNLIRFMYVTVIFILIFNSCHFSFALIIKEMLQLKIKILQKIVLFLILSNLIFVTLTLLTFSYVPSSEENRPTSNKTFEICSGDIVHNGSLIDRKPDFVDTTSFSPRTSVNVDTASFSPSLNVHTTRSSPSVNVDKTRSSPSMNVDTTRSSPSVNVDKTRSSPSVNVDTTRSSPSVKVDKTWSSPSVNVDTTRSSLSVNCTMKMNDNVTGEEFTSLFNTIVFMLLISIGLWIFKFCCERNRIKLRKSKRIVTISILKYNMNIWAMVLFNCFMMIFIMMIYSFTMHTIVNAIHGS